MRRTSSRTRARWARVLGLVALTAILAACSGPQTMLDPEGIFAARPDGLFKGVLWIALAVFIVVQGLIVYTVVRFRQRDGDTSVPKQVHGNTRLEIVWTVIPALILVGIAIPTVQQVFELAEEPEDAYVVEVIGHRWWWEYRYPDNGIITANELVIPVDTNIRLEMRAEEQGRPDRGVLHSFWVPALAGKQDVVPGRVTTLNMRADNTGRYLGQCAEYCGLSHAYMRNRAIVLSADDFEQWVADQQAGSEVAAAVSEANPGWVTSNADSDVVVPDGVDPQLAQGWAVFQNNCASCHNLRGSAVSSADDFVSGTGPDLTHLMSRKEFAGAIFDLYELEPGGRPSLDYTDDPNVEDLTSWVSNAPAMKAMRSADGIGMSSFETSLTDAQLDAVVAFLLVQE